MTYTVSVGALNSTQSNPISTSAADIVALMMRPMLFSSDVVGVVCMPMSSKFLTVYWWKNCENWSIFSEDTDKVRWLTIFWATL